MARSNAVWGIDIGNCSLKALRCRLDESAGQLVAEAFDYIEYPKILSQPGAEPAELVKEALKQFLSRNSVRGNRVAISVPGQNGLARFIKLPPVETRKIPDIVRYEARQQIPFDLQDVIWDYQRMGGALEEEGFVLEAEIGLFAMKRDQVFRALEPFREANIEVDVVQLTPLSLYNYFSFDQLQGLPPPEDIDPTDPPPSTVVLSLGTDATDLVITNGYRVWQRSIPLGGNHFTKALTKELKLTFAKAEHLKRNATAAPDPKAVFQAMRPVFNDLLTEVQRSIGYFTTIDRNAKVERMIALGNAMKLPGLRRYLSQSLGFDVERVDTFDNLVGPEVLNSPAFKENVLCFGVCYGLAVQTVGKAALRTNLLPTELVTDRMIRGKKPWAVAAAAILMLACTINFASHTRALSTVDEKLFASAERDAEEAQKLAQKYQGDFDAAGKQFEATDQIGKNLSGGVEGRRRWLELLRALSACLPSDPPGKRPAEIMNRNELTITNVESQSMEKLEDWFAAIKQHDWYLPPKSETRPGAVTAAGAPAAAAAPAAAPAPAAEGGSSSAAGDAAGSDATGGSAQDGPQGAGYLIQMTGYHYHNRDVAGPNQGAQFLRNTLIEQLHNGKVLLPLEDREGVEWVTMKELGIGYPVVIEPGPVEDVQVPDPDFRPDQVNPASPGGAAMPPGSGMGGPMMGPMMGGAPGNMPGAMPGGVNPAQKMVRLRRFPFVVQFCWQPTPASKRHELKAQAQAQAAQAQGVAAGVAVPGGVPGSPTPAAVPGGGMVPGAAPAGGMAPGAAPAGGMVPGAAPAGGMAPGAVPAGGMAPGAVPAGGMAPAAAPSGGMAPGAAPAGGMAPAAAPSGGMVPGAAPAGGMAPAAAPRTP